MKKFNFRDTAFQNIEKIFKKNKKTILLTNDMGAMGLDNLKKKYKKRVINCGICEQHIMSMAGGLASEGYHVFIYGIISHLIFRGLEQLKIDVCIDSYHVTIVGIGAGLSYGNDGPTHHAIEDIGILKNIPNIEIYNPSDLYSINKSFNLAKNSKKPSLIRLDKENLYIKNFGVKRYLSSINFYKSIRSKCLVITTGVTIKIGLEIKNKYNVDLIDIFQIKPFPLLKLEKIIKKNKYKKIIVIDENFKNSTIMSDLNSILHKIKSKAEIIHKNLGENYILGSAKREWVWKKFNFDSEKIIKMHIDNN